MTAISLPPATCPLLVRHRRSWLLYQPRASPKDGPMGQVSAPCTCKTIHIAGCSFVVLGAPLQDLAC